MNNFHYRLSHCLKASRTLIAMCTISCVHWAVPILLCVFHTCTSDWVITCASKITSRICSVFLFFSDWISVYGSRRRRNTHSVTHIHISIYILQEDLFIIYYIRPLLVRIPNFIFGIIYVFVGRVIKVWTYQRSLQHLKTFYFTIWSWHHYPTLTLTFTVGDELLYLVSPLSHLKLTIYSKTNTTM